MGSSESKVGAVPSTPQPEADPCHPCQHVAHKRVTELVDPRSPSSGVDRTPIQVGPPVSKASLEVKSECALPNDPRSPSVGVARTPMKDSMRVTVGSFAHRLSMLFQSEAMDHSKLQEEEVSVDEELAFNEPLLTAQQPHHFGSMAEHANLLSTPVKPSLHNWSDLSPFVLLREPHQEEVETETDVTVEESEGETPLHKRLSMSLITCHEGAVPSQIFADVHHECSLPSVDVESLSDGPEHSYALPSVTIDPECPLTPIQHSTPTVSDGAALVPASTPTVSDGAALVPASTPTVSDGAPLVPASTPTVSDGAALVPASTPTVSDGAALVPASTPTVSDGAALGPASPQQPEELVQVPSSVEAEPPLSEKSPAPATPVQPSPAPSPAPSQEQPQRSTGIRCPTLDTKSPSQVVFKPQWLGKGFGASGLRARGLQARGGKGGSSPLAVRVAVKNVANENKGQSSKPKQKGNGLAEGRSPLQVLKEANSPRDQPSQMMLKASTTPDRQRSKTIRN